MLCTSSNLLHLEVPNHLCMTWYFNNEGLADGPYEDEAMRALVGSQKIKARTLIWHPGGGGELWQEVMVVSPSWWQPVAPASVPVGSVSPGTRPLAGGGESTSRNLVPLAPVSQSKITEERPGFLKRIFGLGGKKGG